MSPLAPELHRIWRTWSALLLACALAAALLGAWKGTDAAASLQRQEQEAVLTEIGRSIAASLEQAQALGIPLEETVGLSPWLTAQSRSSTVVAGMAVSLASGELLAQHGVDASILQFLRRPGSSEGAGAAHPLVSIAVKQGHGSHTVAWLHVVGTPRAGMWPQLLGAVGLALALSAAGALLLRIWLARRIGTPLARIRQHLTDMASSALVSGTVAQPAVGQHTVARLDQALANQWRALQLRQAQLLQKLNEVRAAHFDNAVLTRIDALAAPLLCAPPELKHTDALPATALRGWAHWSLNRRVSTMLWAGWLLTLFALLALQAHEQARLQHAQTQAQTNRLQTALDNRIQHDLARLDPLVQPAMADAVVATGSAVVQAVLPADARWWMRAPQDQAWDATGTGTPTMPAPASLMDDLTNRREAVRGIWLSADDHHSLRLGTGKTVAMSDGSLVSLLASQPLAVSLDGLLTSLNGRFALADHRGQAMGADPHALVRRWQDAGRQPVAPAQATDPWLLSVPLMSHSGHTLGHLVAAVPDSGWAGDTNPAGLSTLLILVFWGALGGLTWLVRQQLGPLGEAGRALARLAETAAPVAEELKLEAFHQDIARVENRLDALKALRRSRERQGRRQARFIRHQMLELANRLDETARADVLKDLERIESASLQPTHPATAKPPAELSPRFERMADEVGVLALGFQNLVGRVGDQYQQLGHLVQELREALRVKTQFIAIQQELEIARKMQLSFLPHDFSNQRSVQLHGMTLPAREVGGDFYDFFRLDDDHLSVLVADVSGKGVPAAFFMAVSRTLLRAVAQFSTGPADCLQRLNDLLAADNEELMFVTLFYAVIDTRDGSVVYSNAGHNPPYVVRGNGQIEAIPILGDMALAVMPDMPYAEQRLQLAPGDALFLYTDGVTEAANPAGQWYGEPLLEAYLQQQATKGSVESVNHGLIESVKQFEAGGAQSDDVTCLLVRFTPTADAGPSATQQVTA